MRWHGTHMCPEVSPPRTTSTTSLVKPVLIYGVPHSAVPWQVVLLGVCCSGEGGLDMQLQPLPLYTAPSNGDSQS